MQPPALEPPDGSICPNCHLSPDPAQQRGVGKGKPQGHGSRTTDEQCGLEQIMNVAEYWCSQPYSHCEVIKCLCFGNHMTLCVKTVCSVSNTCHCCVGGSRTWPVAQWTQVCTKHSITMLHSAVLQSPKSNELARSIFIGAAS